MNTLTTFQSFRRTPKQSVVSLPTPAYWYMFRSIDIDGINLKNLASGEFDAVLSNINTCSSVSKFAGDDRNSLKTSVGHIRENSRIAFDNSGMTICYWIKYNNLALGGNPLSMNGTGAGALLMETTTGPSAANGKVNSVYLYTNGNNPLNFNKVVFPRDYFEAKDEWIHLCITYGGNTSTLYLNNTVAGVIQVSVYSGWPSSTAPNSIIGGGSNAIDASMDDFRLYNTVLTPAQIATIYNFDGVVV